MKYISSKDAAELAGVSHSHMKKLLQEGEVKGTKIGRDWLVDAKSLNYQRKRKPKTKREES